MPVTECQARSRSGVELDDLDQPADLGRADPHQHPVAARRGPVRGPPTHSQRVTPDKKSSTRAGSETCSHTDRGGGARIVDVLGDPHPITGKRRSAASALEGLLHHPHDVLVDLVDIGLGAELLAQVDRRQRLDRDLGGQRDVAEQVADVQPPRERERERQHLQAQQPVEAQQRAGGSPARRGTAPSPGRPPPRPGTIGTSCSIASRMKPLRPPKSTRLRSQRGRWTS